MTVCCNRQVLVQFSIFIVSPIQLMATYSRISGRRGLRGPSKRIPCVKASRRKKYAPHATSLTEFVNDIQIDEGEVCYVKDLRLVASMKKNSLALAAIAAPANLVETEGEHAIEVRWKAFQHFFFQHCHCLSLSPPLAHGKERN